MAYCAQCSGTHTLPHRVGRETISRPCRACRVDTIAERFYNLMMGQTMGATAISARLAFDMLPSNELEGWRLIAVSAMTMER